jgi:hypothetical protein
MRGPFYLTCLHVKWNNCGNLRLFLSFAGFGVAVIVICHSPWTCRLVFWVKLSIFGDKVRDGHGVCWADSEHVPFVRRVLNQYELAARRPRNVHARTPSETIEFVAHENKQMRLSHCCPSHQTPLEDTMMEFRRKGDPET